ncbi:hypothetical protein XELAEV_18030580mg [Xenopus laevis]|uniref:Uncharacterized protein n=1 Tax=Xenopus laevis TaxID=8355 RepID=A0A974CNC6_XENLA|nr:hypothetical protein XELAEV_18030580mg [Xenopus laevis]
MHWKDPVVGQKGNPYSNGLIKQSKGRVNGEKHFHFSLQPNLMVSEILCSEYTSAGCGPKVSHQFFYSPSFFSGEAMIYLCDCLPQQSETHILSKGWTFEHILNSYRFYSRGYGS